MIVTFVVMGNPKAQPRIKAAVRKGAKHASVYTPATAADWKKDVVAAGDPHRPSEPISGPVRVDLAFFFKRPKRLMRKKDPDDVIWHTKKPDKDNLEKAVLDCLTKDGWFLDDSQVCAGEVLKYYTSKSQEPRLVVTVSTVSGPFA